MPLNSSREANVCLPVAVPLICQKMMSAEQSVPSKDDEKSGLEKERQGKRSGGNDFWPKDIMVEPAEWTYCPPKDYENRSEPRAGLFIANCNKFEGKKERNVSECDVANLICLFHQIGYEIQDPHIDFTKDKFLDCMSSLMASKIHNNVHSFVGVVMNHGSEFSFVTSKEELITARTVNEKFDNASCLELHGKPKIFTFHHCRGFTKIEECSTSAVPDHGQLRIKKPTKFDEPDTVDVFVCHLTVPGKVSYRYVYTGGVYIEYLCRVYMKGVRDTHLYDLIKKINDSLASHQLHQQGDICAMAHVNHIYFKPKGSQLDRNSRALRKTWHLPLNAPKGATSSASKSMEPEASTAQGTTGMAPSAGNPSSEGTEKQSAPHGSHTNVSQVKTDSLKDDSRDCVYILNYLDGCKDDDNKLENLFNKLGYKTVILPKFDSFQSLKEEVQKHNVNPSASVVVLFFGYGYDDNLFIGPSVDLCLPYKTLCEIFWLNRKNGKALVMFTNVCFKYKTDDTVFQSDPLELVRSTYHMCVKVNGDCPKGSALTEALLQEYKDDGFKEEFVDFSWNVKCKMDTMKEAFPDTFPDTYITDFRFYGITKNFHFNAPS